MNRRVLLVDADPAFQGTLTKQLGRYRVVLMTEHEPDRALQLAQADLPDLVVIGVEEPEKLGFKTFQKLRKALPAKVPIMLVTASLAPEAFAKHKTMKVHANEYMDKRGLTNEELIAKIDNLIGLGDLQEDDVSVPVEDDIPMEIAEGDVVLDEQLDDDSVGSFVDQHDMQTVGPNSGVKMSDIVEAETDAAFAALLGGDDEPAPAPKRAGLPGVAPIAEPVQAKPAHVEPAHAEPAHEEPAHEEPAHEEPAHDEPPHRDSIPEMIDEGVHDSGVPEPLPHKLGDDHDEPEEAISQKQWDADSIPAPVHDGGRPSSTYDAVPPDDFEAEEHVHVGAAPDVPAVVEEAAPEPIHHVESDREPVRREPSAPIAAAVEKEPSAPVAAAAPAHDVAEEDADGDSLAAIPVMDDELISLDDEMPVEMMDEEPAAAPAPAAAVDADATVAREPIVPDAARRPDKKTGKVVDLGLDQIAESADAERDQSGVYDRKALRKIGDLEHQISQLKTELERVKAQADANASGGSRESQFLKLREDKLAKEKELKDAKKAVETQAKELAEATEKLRQALHAKEQLEAKNTQLEERLLEDSGKAKDFGAKVQTLTAQVHQLETDLDAKTRAANTAETALAQVEKDLATERANRAASASEAERTLRIEQERTIARHKGELAALRAELETVQDQALARQKEELEAAHAAKLDETIEELRAANMAEHTEAIEALEKKHNAELVNLKAEHAGELTRHKSELGGRVSELEAALAEAHAAHAEALSSHEAALAEAKSGHEAALSNVKSGHEAALSAAQAGHASAVAALQSEHQSALDQMRQTHEATIESLRDEHAEAIERNAESHGQALAQLKSQLDRATAAHEVKLNAVRKEADEAAQQFALDKATLEEEHETAVAELKQAHEAALAEAAQKHEAERASLADAARRAADSHQAALAALRQQHDEQLADAQATAQREIAEAKAHANATKKAAEEAAARAAAESEELRQAHASAIGELEAKHERAIAVVHGEALKAKAVADAERQKAEQALRAEHERARQQLESAHAVAIADLSGERDELKKGLSGARESLKRSEAELASAVQTIADRNAEIRAHQAAIAERDQRIADLRKEIEGLEAENANYQDQVLRAYQKIKSDEAMVARARKAMAIALTVLDDQGNPTDKPSS